MEPPPRSTLPGLYQSAYCEEGCPGQACPEPRAAEGSREESRLLRKSRCTAPATWYLKLRLLTLQKDIGSSKTSTPNEPSSVLEPAVERYPGCPRRSLGKLDARRHLLPRAARATAQLQQRQRWWQRQRRQQRRRRRRRRRRQLQACKAAVYHRRRTRTALPSKVCRRSNCPKPGRP